MPKSLVYSYKTIDQSYMELKRKTQQLETMMGEQEQDQDFGRVSRSSWKNVQDDTPGNENLLNNKENNHGLFSKFLSFIGCVQRDNNPSTRLSVQN